MILSLEQESAKDRVGQWIRSKDKPFLYLAGHAGTGKSTLVKHIADSHDGPVAFVAPTGKAAEVLTRKGCPATTVHARLYTPLSERTEARELEAKLDAETDEKECRRIIKRLEELNSPHFIMRYGAFAGASLIVLDEASMVDETVAQDLLSLRIPILALGDQGQLPPVSGAGYFTKNGPDIELTEVFRQALDSPVIRLALLAREGKTLPFGSHGTSKVIRRKSISKEDALGVEQILTGSNKARIALNYEMRELKGFQTEFPLAGEKVICLRNNAREGLLNGMIFETSKDSEDLGKSTIRMFLQGHAGAVIVHKDCFQRPEAVKAWSWERRRGANEFDFSYAVTVHKFQGSQAKDGLLLPDFGFWDKEFYKKLLYTGITRFSDAVTVAMGKA